MSMKQRMCQEPGPKWHAFCFQLQIDWCPCGVFKEWTSNILQQSGQLKSCHQVRKSCSMTVPKKWRYMNHYNYGKKQLQEVSTAYWSVIEIPHSKRRFSSSTVVSGIRSKTKRLKQLLGFALTIFPSSKVIPKGTSTRKLRIKPCKCPWKCSMVYMYIWIYYLYVYIIYIYCTKMQKSKFEHKKHNMQRKRQI